MSIDSDAGAAMAVAGLKTAAQSATAGDPFKALKLIVLSDGRPGNDNQSLGVAGALGVAEPEVVRFHALRHGVTQWLPVPWVYARQKLDKIPPADLLVATGWQMSRISRWVRRQRAASARPVLTVQMMRPSGRAADYDVVALLWHDTRKSLARRWMHGASNIIVTLGAANLVTPARIDDEAARWEQRLRHFPAPRLAVMVGGDSRHGPMRPAVAHRLMDSLLAWGAATGGSLLVTTSRRSGTQISTLIANRLKAQMLVPYRFWRPDDPARGDNPYLAYLAHADAVVATDDSISMVSEGMAAARPVYLFGDEERVPKKFRAFFDRMEHEGRLTRWRGRLSLDPPRDGLNDAALIAGFVRARWQAGQR